MSEATDARGRERELILAPNEFAYISDETKGDVNIYVGPKKDSLANTDRPVIFNINSKRFERVELAQAIQKMATAPEGWYVVLKNPAKDNKIPQANGRPTVPDLNIGRKINLPGPVSFALWPGQMVEVRQGHHIRSNQYLLVRVYEETSAKEQWKNTVIRKATAHEETGTTPETKTENTVETKNEPTNTKAPISENLLGGVAANDLTMGQLIVIKGTDVSFFIPPTGIEVLADEKGNLVRSAVTLEQLEYCLLLDQNGQKRYERGPAVVFPRPTEVFQDREIPDPSAAKPAQDTSPAPQGERKVKTRKFKAIELGETAGVHVKVIADYEDDDGTEHKVGDELFIVGQSERTEKSASDKKAHQNIYFPRGEHATIKYGSQEVHYATAIPAGEARYVLMRLTGEVKTVHGPQMYLPDPRYEVFCKRVLDDKLCELLYPGNTEAAAYNGLLRSEDAASDIFLNASYDEGAVGAGFDMARGVSANYASPAYARRMAAGPAAASLSNTARDRGIGGPAAGGLTGDAFDRKNQYTEPRVVTLNTKYKGVVQSDIWTGYAIKLVSKSGKTRVEIGPKTVMFEYDELPQILKLSTGKPKNADQLYKVPFLQVYANKVTDVIDVETQDLIKVGLKLSYRVNFEGPKEKWFDVENYVKFLCDHMRSKLHAAARRFGVEKFYENAEDIVRDVVLGTKPADAKERPGTLFVENGMRIYDVEVLTVELKDAAMAKVLVDAQREAVNQRLTLAAQERKLDFTSKNEKLQREIETAQAETRFAKLTLAQQELVKTLENDLARIGAQLKTQEASQQTVIERQTHENEIADLKLAAHKASEDQAISFERQRTALNIEEIEAEVKAVVEKANAIKPDLIAALQGFGDKQLVAQFISASAPLELLGGTSVVDVLKKVLEGFPALTKHLPALTANGQTKSAQASA